ncbi:MAG: methyltransferase domain-containing protein, partial [Gemmatimonadetes bacterium]|nr:class I SAM-dependent methyltransferase [Gemmatimonadota bacterium]NIR79322.1 class I SAM-dependent methyltransferase [Gemmatimonadota bacterium]NIT87978.1 class I SAM-dependent methyltransferase [Gemmatimonadota bacterium]NIU31829.1 class I SAM-dependent methyltransferase [Gemmatimonadota bacterium]NIU36446.1 methyltransferase domain-containing protein [Gemmatimonadota bacterium]
MSEAYEGSEKRYWNERIRGKDRYTAIGRRSLPETINRHRKVSLYGVIDAALEAVGLDLAGARVLDAGCGTGVYSEHYGASGAQVAGVDLSLEGLRATRRHGVPGAFAVASLSRLPFGDRRFDLTHVFSVLYHVVDDGEWRASLAELSRVTRPGGVLLMRIEWVESGSRVSEHVKHRPKDDYLGILTGEEGFSLAGVHPFRDVVPLQPAFALAHRVLPTTVSEGIAT